MTPCPSLEVIAVEWGGWKEGDSTRRERELSERIGARIVWMDVSCHVCGRSYRAERAAAPGLNGFYQLIYHVTIACECGALVGMRTEDLAILTGLYRAK